MSGISPIVPSNISSVGASLLTSGKGPDATAAPAASQPTSTVSPYQTEYANLQRYDNQELLYASFLSPDESLANGNAVLQQAAQLLGSPGTPGTSITGAAPPATTPPAPAPSTAVDSLPSVASILAASDDAAAQTLAAYAKAPAGSSIIDFQA